ncbi:MAG: N(4)-(beta-N-acetylglucosaminyl)-L-asparaginase [Verrucomicrobia bacterium]|nr:N(4)-(beta-N-acetylglucosaminyl)-L-asparaginase [Verrucomicrobiota bacterium]
MGRREFLQVGATLGAAAGLGVAVAAQESKTFGRAVPVVISSANGLRATEKAMHLIRAGTDTLDAAIAGVNIVEEDPNDITVGYGGLPNERGVVELDACVMHGPTYRAGAVGALQNIKTPSKVAKTIMDHTNHILLVGQGALDFAKMYGFKEENLLTDKARELWVRWKENLSPNDDWIGEDQRGFSRPTGTITCLALNEKGDLSGCTSTSGLAFKIPGRVGDSPLIGDGLYVDNDVGACGSTGRGEAVILSSGSRIVVENMRHGMSPEEAILDVLKRICRYTSETRWLHSPGKPKFDVNFYAINKKGDYAAAAIYKGSKFSVHDGLRNTHKDSGYLFEKA